MCRLLTLLELFFLLSVYVSANPTISVTGQASTTVDPTDVIISFSVKTLDNEAGKALSENNRKMNAIVASLKTLNIADDELGTSSFTISSRYENVHVQDHYENVFKGYEASQTLSVKTKKFYLAGSLIDRAIAANDDTTVNSVSFFVADDVKKQIKNDLIQKAVMDAKNRANLALGVLNLEVNLIETLNLNDFNDGAWDSFRSLQMFVAGEDKTTLFPGSSEITFSVSASFSVKQKK